MDARLLIAADWSVTGRKRWSCTAHPSGSGFIVDHPVRGLTLPEQPAIVGLDFPIGLPEAYCTRVGLPSFLDLLEWSVNHPEWSTFTTCTNTPSLRQPFYPQRPGGRTQLALTQAIGLTPKQWLRECDTLTGAGAMFWTIGPKQVGKAALAGWRDLLLPNRHRWKLWPFEGDLDQLDFAFAEIYPAHAYRQIGLPTNFGKGTHDNRHRQLPIIRQWAETHNVQLPNPLDLPNDDAFDALLGVLGMIAGRPEAPRTLRVRRFEGWILGLNPPATAARE